MHIYLYLYFPIVQKNSKCFDTPAKTFFVDALITYRIVINILLRHEKYNQDWITIHNSRLDE